MVQEISLRSKARPVALLALVVVGVLVCWLELRDPVLLAMLFFAAAFGGVLTLGYPSALIIDRGLNRVRLKYPAWSRDLGRLEDMLRVEVRQEVRGSGKSRRTVYPVRINEHEANACSDYLTARRLSEKLAVALQVNIEDGGQGEVQTRDFRTVNARWVDTARPCEGFLPAPPHGLIVLSNAPNLVVRLPAPSALIWVGGVLVSALVAYFLYTLAGPLYAAGAAALVLGGTFLTSLPSTLEASSGQLRVRGALFAHRVNLERVEEVRCHNGSGLLFIDDHAVYRVWSNLDDEQGGWLKEALLRALGR